MYFERTLEIITIATLKTNLKFDNIGDAGGPVITKTYGAIVDNTVIKLAVYG